MRERLRFIVLAIAGIGLLTGASIRGQQPTNNASQGEGSNAKPCVVIFGAVRSPARIEMRRRLRLAEVLVIAGGVTERVGQTIQIVHSGSECFQGPTQERGAKSAAPDSEKFIILDLGDLLRGDEKANPYIEAGDVVIVTESDPIYIMGSVVSPQAIYPKEPVTLLQAIKLAGGVITKAKTDKVAIYRSKADRVEHIMVDLNEIRKHRTKDFILQLRDIGDVGASGHPVPGNKYPIFDSRPLIPLPCRIIY